MQKILSRGFALWLIVSCAICGIFLFAYWAAQQEYRLGADDPQIQMAEDAAAPLVQGVEPRALLGGLDAIDLSISLAPWLVFYDSSGTPIAGSGTLDGALPKLPAGVFDTSTWRAQDAQYAAPSTETRFTWEPAPGVRQAVTLVRAGNGEYVAAGRSMRVVEDRILFLTHGAAAAWAATEIGTLLVIFAVLALGWL